MEDYEITPAISALKSANRFRPGTLILGLFFMLLGFILLLSLYKQLLGHSGFLYRHYFTPSEIGNLFAAFNLLSFAMISIGLSVANRSLKDRRMEAVYSALLSLESNQLMEMYARNSRPSS